MTITGFLIGAPLRVLSVIAMCGVVLGCGAIFVGANDPPAGAQVVRIEVNNDQISLHPSAARAGTVWLEFPDGGAEIDLVSSGAERLQPLTDDEIARIGRQDIQGMTINGVSGAYGSRFAAFDLQAGKYAFVIFDYTLSPDVDPVGHPPISMAILELSP